MNDIQYTEMRELFEHLEEQDLDNWSREFVEDMLKRFDATGTKTPITALQLEQINRLKEQYPMNAKIGHNSGAKSADVVGVSGDRLRSFIERIERLEEEKKALAEDIREVYSEAKGTGYDVKIMRMIIRLRKMDANDRAEMEEILDVYKRALLME